MIKNQSSSLVLFFQSSRKMEAIGIINGNNMYGRSGKIPSSGVFVFTKSKMI